MDAKTIREAAAGLERGPTAYAVPEVGAAVARSGAFIADLDISSDFTKGLGEPAIGEGWKPSPWQFLRSAVAKPFKDAARYLNEADDIRYAYATDGSYGHSDFNQKYSGDVKNPLFHLLADPRDFGDRPIAGKLAAYAGGAASVVMGSPVPVAIGATIGQITEKYSVAKSLLDVRTDAGSNWDYGNYESYLRGKLEVDSAKDTAAKMLSAAPSAVLNEYSRASPVFGTGGVGALLDMAAMPADAYLARGTLLEAGYPPGKKTTGRAMLGVAITAGAAIAGKIIEIPDVFDNAVAYQTELTKDEFMDRFGVGKAAYAAALRNRFGP